MPPADNLIKFREEGNVVVVDVRGKLTVDGDAAALGEILWEMAEAGFRNVLLNLADVPRIDTAGVDELAACRARLLDANGELKLLNLPYPMRSVFRAAGVDSVFEIYDEERAAILSFYGAPLPV